jgi:hypothetical protein
MKIWRRTADGSSSFQTCAVRNKGRNKNCVIFFCMYDKLRARLFESGYSEGRECRNLRDVERVVSRNKSEQESWKSVRRGKRNDDIKGGEKHGTSVCRVRIEIRPEVLSMERIKKR